MRLIKPIHEAILSALVVLVAVVGSILLLYWHASNIQMESARENLANLASAASLLIDVEQHQSLETVPDRPSSRYDRAVAPLVAFHRKVSSIKYLYTMVRREGKIRFVLDTAWSIKAANPDLEIKGSEILEPYMEQDPEMIAALREGRTLVNSEPQTDRFGTFLSGFSPFFDRDGKLAGIVGVDYSLGDIRARSAELRRAVWSQIFLAVAMSMVIGVAIWRERNREFQDRIERDKINAALDQSRARFLGIAEAAGEYLWELDAELNYTMISDRIEQLLGYNPREMVGRHPWEFSPAEDVEAYRAFWSELMTEPGRFRNVEIRKRHLDGRELWISISGNPFIDAAEKIAGYRGTGNDITERHEFIQQLEESKNSAEAADRAKSEFLAVMSHEIRTPMNGVLGFTNLLAQTGLDPQQREYVQTIQQSGDALIVIINDILDFSKIESGQLKLERTPFGIRDCLYGVLNLTAHQASAKGIELRAEIGDHVPQTIRGDMNRLRQVLLNLVGNAIKFTEKGEVVVGVDSRRVGMEEGKVMHRIEFRVSDTGIGIDHASLHRLFHPFSQADTSTTRRFGGTGLGLAICRRLVELMEGEIGVESTAGAGSTFFFHFIAPEDTGSETAPATGTDMPAFSTGKRVLLAIADAATRRSASRSLHQWGISTSVLRAPGEVVRLFGNDGCPDLILLDDDFSEDGPEGAAHRFFEATPEGTAPPPIIFLSRLPGLPQGQPLGPFAATLCIPLLREPFFEAVTQILSRESEMIRHSHPTPAQQSPDDSAQLRILLAEDNPVNQRVATLMLNKLGYQAEVVSDGVQALERFRKESFDAILMDIQMPNLDGLDAARHIRAMEPMADGRPPTYIIAVTADAIQGDRERALEAGMNDYLTKPLQPAALKEALSRAFARRSD